MAADLGLISGPASLDTVLSNVSTLRILAAAAGPAWQGDAIVSTLGVDNVADPGPEITLPALGHLGVLLLSAVLAATGLGLATAAKRRLT